VVNHSSPPRFAVFCERGNISGTIALNREKPVVMDSPHSHLSNDTWVCNHFGHICLSVVPIPLSLGVQVHIDGIF
jgi:hypothetical protein